MGKLWVGLYLLALPAFVQVSMARQTAAPAPSLSLAEQLKLENVVLKQQLVDMLKKNSDIQASYGACQAQLGPLQNDKNMAAVKDEYTKVKAEVEAAHPGYTFDPASGQLQPSVTKPVASPGRGGGR